MKKMKMLVFQGLTWALDKFYPIEFKAFTRIRVLELSTEVAQNLFMQHLDKEKFQHCELCPQRFGLRKIGQKYRCARHIQRQLAVV